MTLGGISGCKEGRILQSAIRKRMNIKKRNLKIRKRTCRISLSYFYYNFLKASNDLYLYNIFYLIVGPIEYAGKIFPVKPKHIPYCGCYIIWQNSTSSFESFNFLGFRGTIAVRGRFKCGLANKSFDNRNASVVAENVFNTRCADATAL